MHGFQRWKQFLFHWGNIHKWCPSFSGYIWPTYTITSNFGGSCWTPLPTLKSDIINALGLGFNVFFWNRTWIIIWKHLHEIMKNNFRNIFFALKIRPIFCVENEILKNLKLYKQLLASMFSIRFEIDERKCILIPPLFPCINL